jgi:hypothetical protein
MRAPREPSDHVSPRYVVPPLFNSGCNTPHSQSNRAEPQINDLDAVADARQGAEPRHVAQSTKCCLKGEICLLGGQPIDLVQHCRDRCQL